MIFFLKKILSLFLTLLFISLLTFFLIRLIPGDPVMLLLGERGGHPETYQRMQTQLGLDRSLPEQYFIYLKNIFSGNWGTSIITQRSVLDEFWGRFPVTLELGLCALLFALLLGIPIGISAALKRGGFLDYSLMSSALVGYSLPVFFWGPVLIMFFSLYLGLTPVAGRIGLLHDVPVITGFLLLDSLHPAVLAKEGLAAFMSALSHLILPTITLGTIPLASIARITRSSMLDVLSEDYMRTARAKGLSPFRLYFIHALKNALIPITTIIGLIIASLIGGAILTETIFSWPGLGRWLVTSINARDYPVIQGAILIIASMIVLLNAFIDLCYQVLDPRLKNQRRGQ